MTGFTLKINMGNEAMQTLEDITEALRQVANRLDLGCDFGNIFDRNGNMVGEFSVWE
jgi:hypothetical protein